ncbi:MAG: hypothetical protein AABW83_00560 [Nanoarchaeota archaeon]
MNEISIPPSYFFSLADIFVAIKSPKYDKIRVFSAIDKRNWTEINVIPLEINNIEEHYKIIGKVAINQKFNVFLKTEKISDVNHPDIKIKINKRILDFENKRFVLMILVFVSLLGFTFSITKSYDNFLYNKFLKIKESIIIIRNIFINLFSKLLDYLK